ncbi:unnamed protein product [Rangifer tarandus platyrhynchus]|uniref:Uncharacterized protein n=2 Tax=Rangifer tarandus platyrhynchus TaxID=3082113 RepID=A0ABN8YN15_RANTA|nr:unnamed protein product [Rangifer tarandus platyrhynchus]
MCVLSGVYCWCVVSPLPIQLRPDEIAQFTCLSLSPGVGIHVTASPLPQSPELFVTTLFSILTAPPKWAPCVELNLLWVYCHSWLTSPTCRIKWYFAHLIHNHDVDEKPWDMGET